MWQILPTTNLLRIKLLQIFCGGKQHRSQDHAGSTSLLCFFDFCYSQSKTSTQRSHVTLRSVEPWRIRLYSKKTGIGYRLNQNPWVKPGKRTYSFEKLMAFGFGWAVVVTGVITCYNVFSHVKSRCQQSITHQFPRYPLVNIQKAIENGHL